MYKKYLLGTAAVLALLVGSRAPYYLGSHENGVITSFGKIKEVVPMGLHLKWPWESVTPYNVGMCNLTVIQKRPPIGAQPTDSDANNTTYTKDQQAVYASVAAQLYLGSGDALIDVHSKFPTYEEILQVKLKQAMKEVLGHYNTTEIANKRQEIANEIKASFQRQIEEMELNGKHLPVQVSSAQLDNFDFSHEYEDRVEKAAAAKTELTAAEIQEQTAQVNKRIQILNAEAASQSSKLQTDATAYGILQTAIAAAKGIELKQSALKQSPLFVELTKAEHWDGALPKNYFANIPLPFFNATDTVVNDGEEASKAHPPSDKKGAPSAAKLGTATPE